MDEWKKKNEERQRQMMEDYHESIMTCSREDSSLKKVKHNSKCSNRKSELTNCDSAGDSNSDDDDDDGDDYRPYKVVMYKKGRLAKKRSAGKGRKSPRDNNYSNNNGIKGDACRSMFSPSKKSQRTTRLALRSNSESNHNNTFRSPRLNNKFHNIDETAIVKDHVRRSPRASTKFDTTASSNRIDRNSKPRRSSMRLFNH